MGGHRAGEVASALTVSTIEAFVLHVNNVLGGGSVDVKVDVQKIDLETGDVVLLCSDGLTDMLDDRRIAAILQAEREPKSACERLVTEANGLGGQDNITAIVTRFEVG
jgi:serine/threonine protein phosphatase PrpC